MNPATIASAALLVLTIQGPEDPGVVDAGAHREDTTVPRASQAAITVPLAFEKKLSADSHGFQVLFEYGRQGRIMYEGAEREIKAPALGEHSKVAYGAIYFSGRPEGALDGSILFMVDGYDQPEPRFFIDSNNNLDLTDDELAVELEASTGQYLFTLTHANGPGFTFVVRIGFLGDRPDYVENPEQFGELETALGGYVKRMGGVALAPEHWLANQRLNIRSASVRAAGQAFQIGVKDSNCNGIYGDVGEDLVLVGVFEAAYLSANKSRGATVLEAGALIKLGDQAFEVLEVDPAGAFVRIIASDKPYTRLLVGAPLPAFDLTLFDGSRAPLSSFVEPGKLLLIDFWGHWCAGCISILPLLKMMDGAYSEQLTILSLHNGDHGEARKIIEAQGLGWHHAESTAALTETFLVDQWPYYVLVDSEGRIQELGAGIGKVLELVTAKASGSER